MKYIKGYKMFELIGIDDKKIYEPIIRDILTDIISDGINVVIHDSYKMFGPEDGPQYVTIVITKKENNKHNSPILKFDLTKYKDDYIQLVNYMEEEGFIFGATLFTEYRGYEMYATTSGTTNDKNAGLTLGELLELSLHETNPLGLMLEFDIA